jgi:hypothetical protein
LKELPLVVPFTYIQPETAEALYDQSVTYVDVSPSEDDYHLLLSMVWEAGRGVILVEHDVVPPPGAIDALRSCERLWCGCVYLNGSIWDNALGCTKFSPELMARFPDAVSRMTNTHWKTLDGQLVGYLRPLLGFGAHIHWPAARHMHSDETMVLANCPTCGSPIRFAEARGGPGAVRCRLGHYVNLFPYG